MILFFSEDKIISDESILEHLQEEYKKMKTLTHVPESSQYTEELIVRPLERENLELLRYTTDISFINRGRRVKIMRSCFNWLVAIENESCFYDLGNILGAIEPNTLFEGELVEIRDKNVFVIHDVLYFAGIDTKPLFLNERLAYVEFWIENDYKKYPATSSENIAIELQKYYPVYEFHKILTQYSSEISYFNNNQICLLFQSPIFHFVKYYYHPPQKTNYKIENPGPGIKYFQIKKSKYPAIWELVSSENCFTHFPEKCLYIPSIECYYYMQNILDYSSIPCCFDQVRKAWMPYIQKRHKKHDEATRVAQTKERKHSKVKASKTTRSRDGCSCDGQSSGHRS